MSLPPVKTAMTAIAILALPSLALADPLELKRVALSTGGLGYFEYETQVTGNASVELSVPLSQVDDVLKSLVVYDDKGRIGTVSLPGRQPLAEVFKSLPFDEAALQSPAALLRALSGAEIRVSGLQEARGRILSVVEERIEDDRGRILTRNRVTLMGNIGLSQFVLEEAQDIAFADPALQESVGEALAALAKHGERDKRVLTLTAPGEGERRLRVAYVVEVPLWKTSYRLTLPEASGAGTAALQGWAVLENQSGEDWDGIELSLVSGNPVAFRQALYESYYLARPEIPVQVVDRIMPPVDQVGTAKAGSYARAEAMEADGVVSGLLQASPAPMASADTPATAGILEAAAQEGVSQAIYRFPNAVTVEDGHSLLVPFLDRSLPVERLSFFQPDVSGANPLASLRLENDGDISFPPGLITLYERNEAGRVSYLGDAQIALLPPGENRLISFALDGKVEIDVRNDQEQTLTGVTLRDGILTIVSKTLWSRTYVIKGAADAPREVLLQEPLRRGWTLEQPQEGVEETSAGYRYLVSLQAGETKEVTFLFERPESERVVLNDIHSDYLAALIEAEFIPASMKAELAQLQSLKADLAQAERSLDATQYEQARIVDDQERLRQNLAAVPSDSDLGRRYLKQLSEQEDSLDSLRSAEADQRRAVVQARQALRDFIAGL